MKIFRFIKNVWDETAEETGNFKGFLITTFKYIVFSGSIFALFYCLGKLGEMVGIAKFFPSANPMSLGVIIFVILIGSFIITSAMIFLFLWLRRIWIKS